MRVFQITRGYIQLKLCMQLEYSSLVINLIGVKCFYFFSLFFFKFYFILLYNTVLVLPYINMNLPRVYTCSQSKKVKLLSRVQLFATPWTVAYHTPLSMGFSRQEYWSGLLDRKSEINTVRLMFQKILVRVWRMEQKEETQKAEMK